VNHKIFGVVMLPSYVVLVILPLFESCRMLLVPMSYFE
jgi:hypothetical protein